MTRSHHATAGGSSRYSGELTVAAVPEPETYALMLAGLGLVAYMARRRRQTGFTPLPC